MGLRQNSDRRRKYLLLKEVTICKVGEGGRKVHLLLKVVTKCKVSNATWQFVHRLIKAFTKNKMSDTLRKTTDVLVEEPPKGQVKECRRERIYRSIKFFSESQMC